MTTQKNQDHKFRILCLHGIGTNSDVFEAQTASLRYHLGDNYEFDFVDGAYLWPAAPGIEEVFGTQQACYSYFDGTAGSALAAVDDLAAYVVENGPFDAVLGFSMGSALAATLLLQPRDGNDKQLALTHDSARNLIYSAIFVCGTLPVDCAELRRGTMTWMDAARAHQKCWPVRVPTVHAWSEQDTGYPGESQQLMRMCVEESRVELLHSAGHGIPSKTDEVAALASSVQQMLSSLRARV